MSNMTFHNKELGRDISRPNFVKLNISNNIIPKLLPIIFWPNEILSKSSVNVQKYDEQLHQFIADMSYTMIKNNGVGLSAPQVGKNLNIIIVETEFDKNSSPIVLINPIIVEKTKDIYYTTNEGCLSVPGYYEKRSRPQKIKVRYNDSNGKEKEKEFQGLLSFIIQHEIDHLNGKVFVDDLSNLKKRRIISKVKKTIKYR